MQSCHPFESPGVKAQAIRGKRMRYFRLAEGGVFRFFSIVVTALFPKFRVSLTRLVSCFVVFNQNLYHIALVKSQN
jgi:hypothetical protein